MRIFSRRGYDWSDHYGLKIIYAENVSYRGKGGEMTTLGLKQRLQSKEILAGYVNIIPSAVPVQAMSAAGADWVLIDQEHGPIGPEN